MAVLGQKDLLTISVGGGPHSSPTSFAFKTSKNHFFGVKFNTIEKFDE